MTGRRVVLGVLTFVVATTCVRLGIWQLERLDQRRETNHRIRVGMGAAPVVLDEARGRAPPIAGPRRQARTTPATRWFSSDAPSTGGPAITS